MESQQHQELVVVSIGIRCLIYLDLYFNHFTDRFKILGIDIDAGCGQLKADLNKK